MPEPIEKQTEQTGTPTPGEHVTEEHTSAPTRTHPTKGNEYRGYVNTIRKRGPVIVVLAIIALLVILVLR